MKIRAKKGKRNTPYELVDFLLREFSKDRVIYVHDDELSCNDCTEVEDIENNKDSVLSFLVKFKADQLSDPRAIRPGVEGFLLPEDFDYELMNVNRFFKSISENHYNLKTTEEELKKIAENIFYTGSLQIGFSKEDVDNYMVTSYKQTDWHSLLNDSNKTKWKKYIGKVLKKNLTDNYGIVDSTNIIEAMRVDPTGYIDKAKEVKEYGGFNDTELGLLSSHI